ncbi:unnamed protein product, partial [marine sediment metagenome]
FITLYHILRNYSIVKYENLSPQSFILHSLKIVSHVLIYHTFQIVQPNKEIV